MKEDLRDDEKDLIADGILAGGDCESPAIFLYSKRARCWDKINSEKKKKIFREKIKPLLINQIKSTENNPIDVWEKEQEIKDLVIKIKSNLSKFEQIILDDMIEPRKEILNSYSSYGLDHQISRFWGISKLELQGFRNKVKKKLMMTMIPSFINFLKGN
jgi:hypothetical protein